MSSLNQKEAGSPQIIGFRCSGLTISGCGEKQIWHVMLSLSERLNILRISEKNRKNTWILNKILNSVRSTKIYHVLWFSFSHQV